MIITNNFPLIVDGPDETIPRIHATTPHSGVNPIPTTASPTQHQTEDPRTQPNGSFTCPGVGFFKDPGNPSKFHQCANVAGQLKDYVFTCPNGLHYSETAHVCVP